MMTSPQSRQVQLRWSTHQETVLSNFETLFKSVSLVDVMLSAEGKHLKAHKILLSSCSPYFEEIFKEIEGDKYPVVLLKDVKFRELELLIHFMYHGEVKVSQDDLPSLLSVAKTLRVRGLSCDQPAPPPTNNAKTIPLQSIINSSTSESPTTSSLAMNVRNIPNFTNNSSHETAIKIVDCSSLASSSKPVILSGQTPTKMPGFSSSSLQTMTTNCTNSATSTGMVRIPVLLGQGNNLPPQEGFIFAKPISSPTPTSTRTSSSSSNKLSKRKIRTIVTPNPEAFHTSKPLVLGRENRVTTTLASPVKIEDDDPPVLFPEVELTEYKPSTFEFVSTGLDEQQAIGFEEEEVEMITNGDETADYDSTSNLDAKSGWSFVEPEELAKTTFDVPPIAPPILSRSSVGPRHFAARQRIRYMQALQKRGRIRTTTPRPRSTKKPMFQCNICLKLYQRKGSLVRHEKYECNKPPQFQCSHCGIWMRHTFHKNLHEKSCLAKQRIAYSRALINAKVKKSRFSERSFQSDDT